MTNNYLIIRMPIRLTSLGEISSPFTTPKVSIHFFIFILAHPSLPFSTFTLTHQILPFSLSQHHINDYINISLALNLEHIVKVL